MNSGSSAVGGTIPGILYRLTVFNSDGTTAGGFPKIYATLSRFRAAIRAQENSGLSGRTWIKEGCARGPWLSLEGPVVPSEESMYWTFMKELKDEALEA